MSISEEKLEALIHQAEEDLNNNQDKYKRKLFFYSLLGYSVIFGLIISLIGLVSGTVALAFYSSFFLILLLKKKLIIPLLIMIWVLFKSIWIKWPKPEGYKVTKKECPTLFKELKAMQKSLKTPKIHQVILTADFNAAISQTPRFGALGLYHNTLFLGIELLLTLSQEQAKAVIAHELGHLSGNHSKFNGWIYRVRESWERIMYALDQQGGWVTAPLRAFFDWYAPRFSAYSFALARLNEYEADKVSAEITSNQDASLALVNTYATAPYLEEHYWQEFFKEADDFPEPTTSPFLGLYEFVQKNQQGQKEVLERIKQALKVETTYHNTHPALKDRLRALGDLSVVPKPLDKSAAHCLLDAHLDVLINDFDNLWKQHNLPLWQEHYKETQEEKRRFSELKAKAEASLTQDEQWELAYFTDKFASPDEAFVLFDRYNQNFPSDLKGDFIVGRMKLERKDDSGLAKLEKACESDDFVRSACEIAYTFLIELERTDEANEWLAKLRRQDEIDLLAEKERRELLPTDQIVALNLDKQLVTHIANQLLTVDKVKEIYLAQKVVKHYPSNPVIVFAIKTTGMFTDDDDVLNAILDSLDTPIPVFGISKKEHSQLFKSVSEVGTQIL
ncbi:M48 family metallopeptidase [Pleionea sp. CnH1-48]|uniref:M48 family metallopeptidase n=1 Tax=Pleionea sp. CnH1-48 TaxID=2954494 RepID=UPI002096FCB7|nr:M48 family metallopeptidase [Pleionea sp. CnH1-48]MCO7226721.1 M48 family metallopeptidase [Pleionea sp. CnH1-48]